MIYRQGDVVIQGATIPSDVKEKLDGIIALGESTGHAHRVKSGGKLFVAPSTTMYLRAYSPTTIGHEEHGDIVLPAGEYQIKIQREWNWFSEEVQNVVD